jgi:hypothetical protein
MLNLGLGRALSGACLLALLAPVSAFAGDRVGTLQCRLLGNGISVLVENQQMDCIYRDDAEGAVPAHYAGALTKVGVNVTINGPGGLLRRSRRLRQARRRRRRFGPRRGIGQHLLASALQRAGWIGDRADGGRREPHARLYPAASAAHVAPRPCPPPSPRASGSHALPHGPSPQLRRGDQAGAKKFSSRSVGKS